MATSKSSPRRIVLPVSFEKPPKMETPLSAFVFSRDGKLLQTVPVEKNTAAFSNITANRISELRVFLVPNYKERPLQVATIADLEKYRAYEPVIEQDSKGNLSIMPIPESLIRLWCFRICRLRLRLSKNFTMDGITKDRPLCNARVHVCEIDKISWLLPRIPDYILKRIPELIARPRIPIPIPEPEPIRNIIPDLRNRFDPKARPVMTDNLDINPKLSLPQQPATGKIPDDMVLSLPDTARRQLLSGNIGQIREAITQNFRLLHPIFCHIPWLWPYFYKSTEIATFYTDNFGRIDKNFMYFDCESKPDLYFWVEHYIDGVWTTIYRPTIPCHTYWDYACGNQINIKVTDPRVRWWCNTEVGGDVVWVKTIGHGASVHHIQQTDLLSTIQAKTFNRIGLSDVSVTHRPNNVGDFRRPFGGQLYFLVQFGSGLPDNAIAYYQWSCRKLRNSALGNDTGPWKVMKETVTKSYSFEYTDLSGTHIDFNSAVLGPVKVGNTENLFIIPPTNPANAPINATETAAAWGYDTASVVFDSTAMEDGLYEFKLELYDKAGHKVPGVPRKVFQVPHYASFAPSVNAPDTHLILNSDTEAAAYHMVVRIDNQPCAAEIYKINVDGVPAAANCCGFVKYQPGSDVEISFRAYHPHNFATFGFSVQKGTCNDAAQTGATNTGGMVIGSTFNGALVNYARDNASIYSKTFTPAALLGMCASEKKAAFAESLGVYTLGTDGNTYLPGDASDLAAFALEPA
jgi:hypothetical protein